MKSFLRRYDILFIIFLFFLAKPTEYQEFLAFFEEKTISFRHAVRTSFGSYRSNYFPKEQIFLLTIDENFYHQNGGFSLKRSDLAKMIRNLKKLGAEVIACDLFLQFPDPYGEDAILAQALKDAGNTVLASKVIHDSKGQDIQIFNPAASLKEGGKVGYVEPLSKHNMVSFVHRLRFYPEIASAEGGLPMAVKTVSMYLNTDVHLTDMSLILGDMKPVLLDKLKTMYIDFSPLPKPYRSIREFSGDSAIHYINIDETDPEQIDRLKANVSGKIVIIGDTSELAHNWYDTPAGRMYSCEILADTMATLLKDSPLKSVSLQTELLTIFLMLFILVVCSAFIQDPKWRFFLIVVFFTAYIHFVTLFYVVSGLVVPVSYTLFSGILGYFAVNLYEYFQERKFRKEITAKLHEKQKSLEIAEATYRSIYENAAEGIFQATPNGELINANPSMAKIMGYQSPMDIIKSVTDAASQLFMDPEKGREFIQKIRKHGKVTGLEHKFRQKSGKDFIGLISGRAVKDDYDNILYYEGSLQDLTERIQKEEAERDRKAAEAANVAKSEFLSRMSHEIRNPLNAIFMTTQSELNSSLTRKQRKTLETINSECENLIKILNEVLDLHKIEIGKIELESVDFNLLDLIHSLADLYRDSIIANENELILDIDPEVPTLLVGDPYRLRQIIGNLLSNAAKFTRQGDILVGINCLKKNTDSATLEFFVEDTGLGIKREHMNNLFSPFTQMGNRNHRIHEGAGLGLSICKKLVELIGGRLSVSSEVGKGSRFGFVVQFARQNTGVKEKPELPDDISSLRILVVDDKRSCRKMFEKILRNLNCEPVCVDCAEKAYQELLHTQKPYDLLVIDHEMPQSDGLSAVKIIRENPKFPQPPIILMTVSGNEKTMEMARNAGADVCIIKPIKIDKVLDTILNALCRPQPEKRFEHEDRFHPFPKVKNFEDAAILLVEDNPINQKITAEILKNAGIQVTTANTGKEAVDAVFENRFEAILMDIHMPDMDGYEAACIIRKNPKFKNVPIIAMTASVMNKDKEKCFNSGMNDFIAKPINIENLFSILTRWIGSTGTGEILGQDRQDIFFRTAGPDARKKFPGINLDKAARIMVNNEKLYLELLSEFSKKYSEIPTQIYHTILKRDFKKAQELIHNIKGVAGFLMADNLLRIIQKLELSIFHQNIDNARNLQKELESAFKEVITSARAIEKLYDQYKQVGHEDREPPVKNANSNTIAVSLITLNGLLKDHNLDASDFLDSIAKNVTDVTLLQSLKEVSEQVGHLDFKQAREQLTKIGKSFGVTLD